MSPCYNYIKTFWQAHTHALVIFVKDSQQIHLQFSNVSCNVTRNNQQQAARIVRSRCIYCSHSRWTTTINHLGRCKLSHGGFISYLVPSWVLVYSILMSYILYIKKDVLFLCIVPFMCNEWKWQNDIKKIKKSHHSWVIRVCSSGSRNWWWKR